MMEKDAKIYVAGHRGMVGSAIVRALEREGYHNFVLRTHKELNLCRQDEVEAVSYTHLDVYKRQPPCRQTRLNNRDFWCIVDKEYTVHRREF